MKTENELIAEFMGAERREGPRAFNPDQTLVQWIIKGNPYNQHRDDIKHWYQPVELKYHESWDWLMPVVKRLVDEALTERVSDKFVTAVSDFSYGISIVCPIDGVYKEVIKLINIYNS